ncbi:GH10450 [Drosophila grimshawi]|uniref:GH10450 n=1 Tax=Drosophila grimshawi TaxID=7222 RepID=B4JE16_DROGR|nr:GH10450 [Drosophila grimshawi]
MCIIMLLVESALIFWMIYEVTNHFLIPALTGMSKLLNLNEYVAGVTVMTLGNNAPDIFGGILALNSVSRHNYSDTMAKNLFVSTVISSIVMWVTPFAIDGTFFLRDVGFVLLYVSYVDFTIKMCKGFVTYIWAVSMALVCPIYIIVILIDVYLQYRKDKQWRRESRSTEEMNQFDTLNSPFDSIKTQTTIDSPYADQSPNKFLFRQFFSVFDTLDRNSFNSKWTIRKLWALVKVPLLFCLRFMIPQMNFHDVSYSWSKLLCCIQITTTPNLIIFMFLAGYVDLCIWTVPTVALSTVCFLPISILAFRHSRTDGVPKWYPYISIITFIVCAFVLYATTAELIALMETVGIVLRCSHTFIGCTVFTWGYGWAELTANVGMARKGFPRMAFSACFGVIILSILFCVSLYYIMSTLVPYGDLVENEIRVGYFVNTSGCRMMALRPLPPESRTYLRRLEAKQCTKPQLFRAVTERGKNYLKLTMSEGEILSVFRVESINHVQCKYVLIERYNDFQNIPNATEMFFLSQQAQQIKVGEGGQILRIQCHGANNETVYHDVHFFLPSPTPLPNEAASSASDADSLSVMIMGIDSISHMHFIRSMPLLSGYVGSLPHVEFWGYNRVGRNTYPNLVPLFSGLNEDELQSDCCDGQSYYDECDFLWNRFKDVGYNTSYGEDTRVGGTFNYGKSGFDRQPTDFYLRPVMLEIDQHTRYSIDRRDEIHCTASRKYAEILYEFIYKLMPHMKRGPHFSFFWQSQGVHDYFNYAQFLDEEYLNLLRRLETEGILNSTLVLLMSDHGMRYGSFRNTYQGMLEESQPLLIALYPNWLAKAYPFAISNLRLNAHRLVTTYDLHATLKDLTNLQLLRDGNIAHRTTVLEKLGPKIPRGISLFLPIPEIRNCGLAGIPSSYCLCHTLSQILTTDQRAQRAAEFVVQSINSITSEEKLCQRLRLKEVQAAYLLNQDNNMYEFEVKVRLRTTPGEGQFEGTTRFTGYSLALNGVVIRTNKYANQSYCVENYRIEMYCYCL